MENGKWIMENYKFQVIFRFPFSVFRFLKIFVTKNFLAVFSFCLF